MCLHASRALYLAGDLARAARLVQQAGALADGSVTADDPARLHALATVYRGHVRPAEHLAEAVTAVEPVLAGRAATDPHTCGPGRGHAGLAHELTGNLTAADRVSPDAARLAQAAGVRYLAVQRRGARPRWCRLSRATWPRPRRPVTPRWPRPWATPYRPRGWPGPCWARIARERNDPAQAA
ncbi:MAG: hypothetical protein R2851_15930 [Caldilineaceae bacterium]